MKITINGESVDYVLENEQSAGEIMKGLSAWLDESGLLVGSVKLDDEPVPLGGDTWRGRPVQEINSIAVEALSLRESRVRQLETARDFFLLLAQAAENGEREILRQLSDGYTELLGMLPHLVDEGPYPAILPHLETVLSESGFPLTDDDADLDGARVAAEARLAASFLETRRKEASNPEFEARASASALAAVADLLGDVAVNLQTGKDRLAMSTIIQLTELLQSLLRALSWTQGNLTVEKLVERLNSMLAELEEALKASDTVLIGDLLEYEIKPLLTELPVTLGFLGKESPE